MKPVPLSDAIAEHDFGGKAVSLGRALRAGLPVPDGYALDVALVEAVAGGRDLRAEADGMLAALGGGVAVRSSAVGEDGGSSSFAGQHVTILNVTTPEGMTEAVCGVRESARSEAARAYRERSGLDPTPRTGVVVQRLVYPDVAGVLFTRNPLTGADERVIEAAWGFGEAVVSGLVTPDSFRVARDGRVLGVEPGEKHVALRPHPGGGLREEILDPEAAAAPSLGEAEIAALARLAASCEEVYGPDLDLEWGLAAGALYLLQSRPITTLREREAA